MTQPLPCYIKTKTYRLITLKRNSLYSVVNDKKAKEMIFDPKLFGDQSSASIHNVPIMQVSSYKYLGVHIEC